jgi:hypothetical protein
LQGGTEAIVQFAKNGLSVLTFPFYKDPQHVQERWDEGKQSLEYIGRFGDNLRYNDLPKLLQVESVAQAFGSAGKTVSGEGLLVCGSPGEVANKPELGDGFDVAMDGRWDKTNTIQDFEPQKQSVWTTIALFSEDQLRQRVAWSLSQIFSLAVNDISASHETEPFLTYYDIFVRHAFGNFKDILKEVAYSPMMGEMLSYSGSKSRQYVLEQQNLRGVFPDENFAREVLQLFSIGLVKLHVNGTIVYSEDGTPEPTFDNEDIMDGARAWTGFDRQQFRGNIESLSRFANRIDPMKIHPEWRDPFPKANLHGEYIGDGFPLCVDQPKQAFLKRGATYRLLGSNPTPELQYDPPTWSTKKKSRVILNKVSSNLSQVLCNPDSSNGECRLRNEVTLEANVDCDGMECDIDQPRVIQLDESMNIFFEYIRSACVQFPFFQEQALKIKGRLGNDASAMCADPRQPVAAEACCPRWKEYHSRSSRRCAYVGERVTYKRAKERCQAMEEGNDTCSWRVVGGGTACGENDCCTWNSGYFWTNVDCQILAEISNDGKVALVHQHADWVSCDRCCIHCLKCCKKHVALNYFSSHSRYTILALHIRTQTKVS